MRRFVQFAVIAMMLSVVSAALVAQKDKNAPQTRTLTGTVMNKGDQPLEKALVYLKNDKTLMVQTFITGADGKFRFNSLSPNTDYDLFAEYNGKRSNTRTLSAFDSRTEAYMPLTIDVEK
jgi:protocatechuate 3,4-dioxygenase beta subunit